MLQAVVMMRFLAVMRPMVSALQAYHRPLTRSQCPKIQHQLFFATSSIPRQTIQEEQSRKRKTSGSEEKDSDGMGSIMTTNDDEEKQQQHHRQELLQRALQALDVDAESLQRAAWQSLHDPIGGYDGRFGKSALRTYRAFVQPKKPLPNVEAAAQRTAQQIDFLLKRHASHETAWIRHHDASSDPATTKQQPRFPLVLILDNLRSALNVGSLFRTADAAACAAIWTVGITPHPGGPGETKLAKSALGAERTVPHRHFRTLAEALDCWRDNSSSSDGHDGQETNKRPAPLLVGLETTDKSVPYTQLEYNKEAGVAVVLGNEVTGVTATLLPQMDAIVEIPTFGVKNSLNVAACAPIVVYEILRQWDYQPPTPPPAMNGNKDDD